MSETRAVTLETSVDTTGARAGFQEITREAGTMAASVARASQQADQAVEGIGTSATGTARDVDASARSLIGSIQRTTAAMQAGSRGSAEYFEALARQRGIDPSVLQPYLAGLRAVQQEQSHTGTSAAQTANAMRLIPAQMTDIVTQLQGGQNPFTILLQQGGQLRDSFGSVGATLRGVGSFVLGLINPYTLAAAAVAGLTAVYVSGANELEAHAKAIALSNNAAGATISQMTEMSRQVATITGSRDGAGAIDQLAQTGQVQAQNLQRFATVAVQAQQVMGKAIADTVSEFEKLGQTPLQALDEMSKKYNFVTAATYAQVKALQDQGKFAEAANVAQQAYADGISKQKDRVLDTLSSWEKAWLGLKMYAADAANATIDFMGGRSASDFEKINTLLKERGNLQEQLRRDQARGLAADVAADQAELDRNLRDINAVRDKGKAAKDAASAQAAAGKADQLRIQWANDEDSALTRRQQLQRALTAAQNEGLANGLSDEEIQKRLKVIRVQYNDVFVQGVERQIDAIRRRNALDDLRAQPKLGQINIARTTGAITEDQSLQQTAQVDFNALDRQKKALQDQLALVKTMRDSEQQQDDLRGQLAENQIARLNREEKLKQDLFLADYQRVHASIDSFRQYYDQLLGGTNSARQQTQQQRDYNEQIGLGARELLDLAAARREEQAARLDQNADIAEGLDLTGELSNQYRRQAQELRNLSAAERDGFVKQRDPYVQMGLSLKRYAEDAQNTGALVGDAFTNAFMSAEDAFANFVTTGKLGFKDLATSILADFARIEAKQALGSLASSLLGSMGTDTSGGWGASLIKAISGARADGGPVNAGLSYLVGERGPEIFTPSSSGSITPNHLIGAAGTGGGVTIQTNIQVSTSGSASTSTTGDASATGRALADMISAKAKEVVARETRQGGIIWKLQQGRG